MPEEDQPPSGIVKLSFRTMVGDRERPRGARRLVHLELVAAKAPATHGLVPSRARGRRAPFDRRADRGLDHDGGGAPALGGLRGDEDGGRRDWRERNPRRVRGALAGLRLRSRRSPTSCCGDSRARRSRSRPDARGPCGRADAGRSDRVCRPRRRRLRGGLLGPDRRRGRARRSRAGHDQASDVARLGGQPRLAHLRARHALDGFPGGLRLDHLDARDPPVPRRARNRAARGRVRAQGRGGDDRRGARARGHVCAVLRARSVLPRRRRPAPSRRARFRSAMRPATSGEAGRGRFRSSSACWPWSPGRTWPPSS